MKKILALLLCAVLLSGCQTEKQPYIPTGDGLYVESTTTLPYQDPVTKEQRLCLAWDSNQSLNPYQTGSSTQRLLFNLMYQGLFAVDAQYAVHPILCKQYRISKDMTTYTFYLEAATFADGTLLTAQDVAASLLAAKESPVYSGRFQQMVDARAEEDGAVTVVMAIPYENLPLLLDVPIVKAEEVDAESPMGTGPYEMRADAENRMLLRRENWWCRANMPATAGYITLVKASTPTELRDAFEFGLIDLVCTDPGSESYVDFRCDYELWDCESGYFLYLACYEKSKVFSNVKVRAALTYAINRNLLVTEYYQQFAYGATLPASPESPWYDQQQASAYDYAPEKLQQAVEDAGLTGSTITLLVNQADGRRIRVAKEIAAMLKGAGLVVTISALRDTEDNMAYTNALKNGKYDLHLGQTKLSPNMDLTQFFANKGSLSFGGLTDVVCESLCQEAMANIGNYYSLHKAVLADAMLCPVLFKGYAIYASRGTFETLEPARDAILFYSLGKSMDACKLKD